MAMQGQLWTLSGLAVELGMDRRNLARRLEGLEPDESEGRSPKWRMARVHRHMMRGAEVGDPQREKARLDKLRADKVELELERERGETVSVHEVAGLWAKLASEARARLLGMPTKAAPLVMGCKRVAQAKEILDREVHDALGALADPGAGASGQPAPAAEDDGEPVGGRAPEVKPGKQRRARKVADG